MYATLSGTIIFNPFLFVNWEKYPCLCEAWRQLTYYNMAWIMQNLSHTRLPRCNERQFHGSTFVFFWEPEEKYTYLNLAKLGYSPVCEIITYNNDLILGIRLMDKHFNAFGYWYMGPAVWHLCHCHEFYEHIAKSSWMNFVIERYGVSFS